MYLPCLCKGGISEQSCQCLSCDTHNVLTCQNLKHALGSKESKVNSVGKMCLEIIFISSGWNLFVSVDDTLQ